MHRAVLVMALAGLGATMCQKNIARPPVEEVPIRDPSELAAPPPVATAAGKTDKPSKADKPDKPEPMATSTTPPPLTPTPDDDPPEPPRDRAFPKLADSCKKDEDCAATNLALGGDLLCCTPCKATAGTKAWVRRVEQVCQQKTKAGLKPRCGPAWDCNKPEVECKGGRCAVK
jgi:hypothetical protein